MPLYGVAATPPVSRLLGVYGQIVHLQRTCTDQAAGNYTSEETQELQIREGELLFTSAARQSERRMLIQHPATSVWVPIADVRSVKLTTSWMLPPKLWLHLADGTCTLVPFLEIAHGKEDAITAARLLQAQIGGHQN